MLPHPFLTNCRKTEVSVCCYPLILEPFGLAECTLQDSHLFPALSGSAWTVAASSAGENHVVGLEIGKP